MRLMVWSESFIFDRDSRGAQKCGQFKSRAGGHLEMAIMSSDTINSSLDFARMAQLRNNAKVDEEGSIKEVAQQFESIL